MPVTEGVRVAVGEVVEVFDDVLDRVALEVAVLVADKVQLAVCVPEAVGDRVALGEGVHDGVDDMD